MSDKTHAPTDELDDDQLEAAAGGTDITYGVRKVIEIGVHLGGGDIDITPEDDGTILDL